MDTNEQPRKRQRTTEDATNTLKAYIQELNGIQLKFDDKSHDPAARDALVEETKEAVELAWEAWIDCRHNLGPEEKQEAAEYLLQADQFLRDLR